MTKRPLYFVAALAVLSVSILLAGNAYATKSTDSFVKTASVANQFEITSSQLALQKSQNSDIKQFAQQMVDDHTKAANDLKATMVAANLTEEQPAMPMDHSHQKMIDKLNKLSGADFDKEYVKMQVKAHNDAVSMFADYAKGGDNPQLKDFAGKTLPVLQNHKQHIDQISSSM